MLREMDADKLPNSSRDIRSAAMESDLSRLASSAELCEVVRRLKAVLRPVEPSPVFREELGLRLARTARWEVSPVQMMAPNERTREVLVGAALLSVAGALMYLWRSRTTHDAPAAVALLDKVSPA